MQTVLVKIRKATNNLPKKHVDADFTFANKIFLQDIAALFGPECVFGMSIDDKAKVPFRITPATRQAPLVMHMEYEVRLPDHDFVVASKHKLVPSVYAACEILHLLDASPEILYTGSLYIAIRSLKHESSTAFTHGRDFDHVLELEDFASVAKKGDQVKPIVLAFVDGGPDENPQFIQSILSWRKKTSELSVRSWQINGVNWNSVEGRLLLNMSRTNDVIRMILMNCGSHIIAEFLNTCFRLSNAITAIAVVKCNQFGRTCFQSVFYQHQ